MDKIKDKNPRDGRGRTPLHDAAERGHLEVCHAIIDRLKYNDRSPRDNNGQTPFQLALANGHIAANEDLYLLKKTKNTLKKLCLESKN